MSIFKGGGTDSIKTVRQARDYAMQLNRQVMQVFNAISYTENFSEEEMTKWLHTDDTIARMEKTIRGFQVAYESLADEVGAELKVLADEISMKVKKGELVSELNLSEEDIVIRGNRLEIYMSNLVLDKEQDLVLHGEVTALAGDIGGWKIEKEGEKSRWVGDENSRINTSSIVAQSGSSRNIYCYGDSEVRATLTGHFDNVILDEETVFTGGFRCSCINGDGYTLNCGQLRAYESYRDPEDVDPSAPEHPDADSGFEYPDRYNTNAMPYGGVVVDADVSCREYYTKLSGITWSDRRLKQDIADVGVDAAEVILRRLIPSAYTLCTTGKKTQGVVAQELRRAENETFTRDDLTTEHKGLRCVKYRSLMCIADKVLQADTEVLHGKR